MSFEFKLVLFQKPKKTIVLIAYTLKALINLKKTVYLSDCLVFLCLTQNQKKKHYLPPFNIFTFPLVFNYFICSNF